MAHKKALRQPVDKRTVPQVISWTPSTNVRAIELLAAQPKTLVGLSQEERNSIVVTAVADAQGHEYPVSRFGDAVWDLSSEYEAKNKNPYFMRIAWPDDVPKALVDDTKAALYCALRRGRDHAKPWSASAVAKAGKDSVIALRYLTSLGIQNFGKVRALHLTDYIATLRRSIKATTIRSRLKCIDLVGHFAAEVIHPLPEDPWCGCSLSQACGEADDDGPVSRTGKTPVIPVSVQRSLFTYCESRLKEADALLQRRDSGQLKDSSYELTALRDAILYLVQITSGMRNSESMGLTNNCWRIEVKNGKTYHWLRTREIKTKRGEVDFLVPPETIAAVQVLQRYARPLQDRLAEEGTWLEVLLREESSQDGGLTNGMTRPEALQRLNRIRDVGQYLFLGVVNNGSDHTGQEKRVDVISVVACNLQLRALAKAAGVDWKLANHQCRRTFAFNVANSRLGRIGLIFLKWQLKHASVGWTQLYAANPNQDHGLYRDLEEELVEARTHLMEGWFEPDASLSGGAGKKLLLTRAIAVPNRESLLRHTAEVINIRSTGHAWCISGTEGCGGQGLYDPPMCSGCSQAVIDRSQATQWQMIHMDNLRLAAITDCGQAVAQKAARAIQRSSDVLSDLGVPLPTEAQTAAYNAQTGVSRET